MPNDEQSALVSVTLEGHGQFQVTRNTLEKSHTPGGLYAEGRMYASILANGDIIRGGMKIGTRAELKPVEALPPGKRSAGFGS